MRAEAKAHALRPKNAIDSGFKCLKAIDIFPKHETASPLLDSYFSTWENIYRVVHRDSFWKEYYDTRIGIRRTSLSFRVLGLMMMILGQRASDQSCSPETELDRWVARFSAWVECVENYCYLLVDNQRLDLRSLQIMCLFTLYKGTTCDRNEARVWSKKLVQLATQAELHIDPSILGSMSELDIELRRRLWASVVEIDIQVSFEHGDSLPWSTNLHYTTLEPSSFNDVELHTEPRRALAGSHVLSECDLQKALYQTAKDRVLLLQICFDGGRINKEILQQMRIRLAALDGICISFSICHSSSESSILLRLHILRPIVKAMQYLASHLGSIDPVGEVMKIYHKSALDYLRIYLKLPTSSRSGSLLSSTLFEVLAPVIQIYTDGVQYASKNHFSPQCLSYGLT